MTEPKDIAAIQKQMLAPRKIALQLVGFLIGAALIAYLITVAIKNGLWEDLTNASVGMLILLVALGLLSTVLDGVVFWGVLLPYRKLNFMHVQAVNMSAAFLNLMPVRVGTVFRVVYHAQVDGVPLVPIIGWFAAITLTTVASLGTIAVATLLAAPFSLIWFLLIAGGFFFSGLIIWAVTRIPFVQRLGGGAEKMFGDPRALFMGLVGRALVLSSVCGRLAVAGVIVGLDLTVQDVILLSIAMILVSFNPLGRFGWREATLAFLAPYIAPEALNMLNDGDENKLALIESAGEGIALIMFGVLTLLWTAPRLLRKRPTAVEASTTSHE